MNSMSRACNNDDCNREQRHCPTILKCGQAGGTIPIAANVTTATGSLQLTTVAVNTPRRCNPCVKIDYASTVSFAATTGTDAVTFTVTIFKNCPNNVKIPIGSYNYTRNAGTATTLATTDTFSFFVCDCNNCSSENCYFYSAEVTSATLTNAPTVTINGPILSALAVNAECNC